MHADHRPSTRVDRPVRSGGTSSRRRAAALAGLGLLASAVPVVGVAGPAAAAVECTSEQAGTAPIIGPLLEPACDDQHPPETTFGTVAPAPNAGGWVRENDVTVTFTGSYQAVDDTDTDPIVFECRLDGPEKGHDWRSCTSPVVYTDLAETGADGEYVFQVRAIDQADDAITVTRPLAGTGEDETVADRDATPASASWRIDTTVPQVAIVDGPIDTLTPADPVVTSRRVSFLARSNERTADLVCALDGRDVPCAQGRFAVDGVASGARVLTVQARDLAGNLGTVQTTRFFVAKNLADDDVRRSGWRTGTDVGMLDDDVVQARRRGALLSVPLAGPVVELRLYVPEEAAGLVRMRVGRSPWRRIDLDEDTQGGTLALVRRFGDPFTGNLQIEALERPRRILLDAVLAR